MTFEQIVALLELDSSKAESLKAYIDDVSKITVNKAEDFLKTDEGQKWLRPKIDREVSKGVETFEENFKNEKLEGLIEERIKQLNPETDPKDIEIKQMKEQLQQMKQETKRKELKAVVLEQTKGKLYDGFNFDSLIAEDEEKTKENCQNALDSFNTYMQPFIEAKGKVDAKTPSPENGNTDKKSVTLGDHLKDILPS